MRQAVLAVGAALLLGGAAVSWLARSSSGPARGGVALAPTRAEAPATAAMPPSLPAAMQSSPSSVSAAVATPVAASSAARRPPQVPAAALPPPSVRDFIERGDPRTPPLAANDEGPLPTQDELDDPELYRRYEARQHRALVFAFARAAAKALVQMQADIARARQMNLPPEALREAEDKAQHLKAVLDRIDPVTGELH